LAQIHAQAKQDDSILRISMDAKATLPIGWFSRGGRTRVIVKAFDHDFKPEEKLTPYGIFLPQYDELYLYFTTGRVTSDFIVDCLEDFWQAVRTRFPQVKTLLINQDNGPENHSRRTQFMQRITTFVDTFQMTVDLAYYPPYHSKYNPIERVWGVVEKRWNGSILDTVETVLNFAKNLIWKDLSPKVVKLVTQSYSTGVRLTQKAMTALEQRFERLPGLEKWFVRISSVST
jgi:transposase